LIVCLDFLSEYDDDGKSTVYVDLTFGQGGHTFGLLERLPNARVLAFDQDQDAIDEYSKKHQDPRVHLEHSNFSNFTQMWKTGKFKDFCEGRRLGGILMDLGVSSHQFDSGLRGFSFRHDGPLDMRMDVRSELSASEIINSWPVEDLETIFREYGEEKFSKRIAQEIFEQRSKVEISTTKELENIIFHCYPKKMRHGKTHPATRCFQGLRIAVNRELQVVEENLNEIASCLDSQGRICVISFHSLEDRLVKHAFKKLAPKKDSPYRILTKKPLVATGVEIMNNSRSRSAKLRVLERRSEDGQEE
jgi:16S rRNA (cytosine1402-N4)-methyltransferase